MGWIAKHTPITSGCILEVSRLTRLCMRDLGSLFSIEEWLERGLIRPFPAHTKSERRLHLEGGKVIHVSCNNLNAIVSFRQSKMLTVAKKKKKLVNVGVL